MYSKYVDRNLLTDSIKWNSAAIFVRIKTKARPSSLIPYNWAFACSISCVCVLPSLSALVTIPFSADVTGSGELKFVKFLPHSGHPFAESLKKKSTAMLLNVNPLAAVTESNCFHPNGSPSPWSSRCDQNCAILHLLRHVSKLIYKLLPSFTNTLNYVTLQIIIAYYRNKQLYPASSFTDPFCTSWPSWSVITGCSKTIQTMIQLHFQNICHYNTISPNSHLKISDSLSFFIISAASNVLALFSSNSFSFSWHLKWYIVSSSASNIAYGEQEIHNSGQFMHKWFLVAGLMYIKSGGYMLSIIYSILSVKDNHELVCSLHKYTQNFGWKTFNLLHEVQKCLERSRQSWEDYIKMDCKERELNGVHWFPMVQDRVRLARLTG